MEEFWTRIAPRSIIDEFMVGGSLIHEVRRGPEADSPDRGRAEGPCNGVFTRGVRSHTVSGFIRTFSGKGMTAGPRVKWPTLIIGCFILLIGCMPAARPERSPNDLARTYAPIPETLLPMPEEGSLWAERRSVNPYSDVKARMVGDLLTISVVESAQASKNATTKTARDSGLEANWSGVFETLAKNFTIGGAVLPTSNKVDFANTFDGQGATTRASSMTAYLTAQVLHVLPNGQLVIRGSREVQVNNETQYIFVQGVVRPEDISSNNVILSTYIADARIELTGYGAVSDKQRPGWGTRILDFIWPF